MPQLTIFENPLAPRRVGGVVDPSLKVYGTRNVYVIDASVIPFEPSAHLQVSTNELVGKMRKAI